MSLISFVTKARATLTEDHYIAPLSDLAYIYHQLMLINRASVYGPYKHTLEDWYRMYETEIESGYYRHNNVVNMLAAFHAFVVDDIEDYYLRYDPQAITADLKDRFDVSKRYLNRSEKIADAAAKLAKTTSKRKFILTFDDERFEVRVVCQYHAKWCLIFGHGGRPVGERRLYFCLM